MSPSGMSDAAAAAEELERKTKIVYNQPYDEEVSISDDGDDDEDIEGRKQGLTEEGEEDEEQQQRDEESSPEVESFEAGLREKQVDDAALPPAPLPFPPAATAQNNGKKKGFREASSLQADESSHRESSSMNDDDYDDEVMKREIFKQERTTDGSSKGQIEQQEAPYSSLKDELDNVNVSEEMKEMFSYITAYRPMALDLETELMPFIPEYIPAIGEIDEFIKIPRPDAQPDFLGLKVLDEPNLEQSDPTVLNLQLKALSKQTSSTPVAVSHIDDAESSKGRVSKWIKSIEELHDTKPKTEVRYKTKMPEFDKLMEEWPPSIDDFIKDMQLPNESLNVDNRSFLKIVCSILDIPVQGNLVESLHVLFSLYLEFRDNPHFKSKLSEQRE